MRAFLFLLVFAVYAAALPTYLSPVPLTAINASLLTNWVECLSFASSASGLPLSTIDTLCSGPNLMLACGATGSSILTVAAGGPRATVQAADARYQNISFGLVPNMWAGLLYPETISTYANCQLFTGASSVCWNVANATLQSGGFCGATGYNANPTVRRIVYSDPCGGAAVVGSPCTSNLGLCASGQTCAADGACTGGTVTSCPMPPTSQCILGNNCNPLTGNCSLDYALFGAPCNITDMCIENPICDGLGNCTGNPVTCNAPTQCQISLGCNSTTGCVYGNQPNGTACSDGNACTQGDTCQAGQCVPGPFNQCPAPSSCLNNGTCNPINNQCTYTQKPNGTACISDNLCAATAICMGSTCVPQTIAPCPPPAPCYQPGVCLSSTGNCTYNYAAPGTSCNTSPCLYNMTCNFIGICVLGLPIQSCPAIDQCHNPGVPVVNGTSCVCTTPAKADNTTCSSGDPCYPVAKCFTGSCVPGTILPCPGDQCNFPTTCDSMTLCADPRPDGTPCSLTCRLNPQCASGTCAGGTDDPSCASAGALVDFFLVVLM